MNKKILVLSSSPRKGGNSDILCDEFINGAKESKNETEKIFLRDKKINYCLDCGVCYNEKKACTQKDDMSYILEKMIEADVIVMSTPVYFYTMAAQMKTLIDRTVTRYTEIKNKDFYFIITAADTNIKNMEQTIEGFRAFTYCLDNPKEKGVLYATGVWKKGDVNKDPSMKKAYEMGKNI